MAEKAYQAVGAVAGRLEGGEIVTATDERFPVSIAPNLARWLKQHPEADQQCRVWLAYPRTLREGFQQTLAFHLIGTPEDQSDPRWHREVDRFNIKGQVVVSRSGRDNTVVWIPRNNPTPKGKRRHPDWKGRVLFLRRALRPVRRWKGADVWLETKRVGRELVITTYRELHHHPTTLQLPSGWQVPWPFRPTRSSVVALCKASLAGRPPHPYGLDRDGQPITAAEWAQASDYRPGLRQSLQLFNRLQKLRAVDLVPRWSSTSGRPPVSEKVVEAEIQLADQWGRFFKAVCDYLDSLEPQELLALSRTCDPPQALLRPVMEQAKAWFTVEPAGPGDSKVWYEHGPVPTRVKKTVLRFFADQLPRQEVPDAALAPEDPLECALAYFRSIGCPDTFSSRQTAAWVVQELVAEGFNDRQIANFGHVRMDLLQELKRVELPPDSPGQHQ